MMKPLTPFTAKYNSLGSAEKPLEDLKISGKTSLTAELQFGDSENAVDILACLVKFKFQRQGLTNTAQQKAIQESELEKLLGLCKGNSFLFEQYMALARNSNRVFMRAIPQQLKTLLTTLDQNKQSLLAGKLSADEKLFLNRSGIKLDEVKQTDESDGCSQYTSVSDAPKLETSGFGSTSFDSLSRSSHCCQTESGTVRQASPPTRADMIAIAESSGFHQLSEGQNENPTAIFLLPSEVTFDFSETPDGLSQRTKVSKAILDSLINLQVQNIYLSREKLIVEEINENFQDLIKKSFRHYNCENLLNGLQPYLLQKYGAINIYRLLNSKARLLSGAELNRDPFEGNNIRYIALIHEFDPEQLSGTLKENGCPSMIYCPKPI